MRSVTDVPLTEQTPAVVDAKLTVNPELAVADTVNGDALSARFESAANVIVCDCTTSDDVKVAMTLRAWDMVTVQVPVPEQPAPLQPPNVEYVKFAVQVEPQSIPVGALVTVPVPVPVGVTVSEKVDGAPLEKSAVTLRACDMVTTQVPVPEHPSPLQPVNVDPTAWVAVRVTTELAMKDTVHEVPQSTPIGELVTVPLPAPVLLTASA